MGVPQSQIVDYNTKLQVTATVTTGGPQSQISLFGVLFIAMILALVIIYVLRRYLGNWRERTIEEPFESTDEQSLWSFFRSKLPRTRVLALIIIIVIGIPGVFFIGRMPVHRTNITHTDPEGDVSDSNIDIVQLRSYRTGNDIALEITVAGEIRNVTDSSPYPDPYDYRITIITRRPNEEGTPAYRVSYTNGTLGLQYDTRANVDNNTLTIFLPLYEIDSRYYIIDIKGTARTYTETDTTEADSDRPVERLLF